MARDLTLNHFEPNFPAVVLRDGRWFIEEIAIPVGIDSLDSTINMLDSVRISLSERGCTRMVGWEKLPSWDESFYEDFCEKFHSVARTGKYDTSPEELIRRNKPEKADTTAPVIAQRTYAYAGQDAAVFIHAPRRVRRTMDWDCTLRFVGFPWAAELSVRGVGSLHALIGAIGLTRAILDSCSEYSFLDYGRSPGIGPGMRFDVEEPEELDRYLASALAK